MIFTLAQLKDQLRVLKEKHLQPNAGEKDMVKTGNWIKQLEEKISSLEEGEETAQ